MDSTPQPEKVFVNTDQEALSIFSTLKTELPKFGISYRTVLKSDSVQVVVLPSPFESFSEFVDWCSGRFLVNIDEGFSPEQSSRNKEYSTLCVFSLYPKPKPRSISAKSVKRSITALVFLGLFAFFVFHLHGVFAK